MTIFVVIHSQCSRMQKAPKEGECSLLLSLLASLSLVRSSLLGWTSAPRCSHCHIKQSCLWQGCLKKAWLFTHIGCSSRLLAKYKSPTRCSYSPQSCGAIHDSFLSFSPAVQERLSGGLGSFSRCPHSCLKASLLCCAKHTCRTRVCHALSCEPSTPPSSARRDSWKHYQPIKQLVNKASCGKTAKYRIHTMSRGWTINWNEIERQNFCTKITKTI